VLLCDHTPVRDLTPLRKLRSFTSIAGHARERPCAAQRDGYHESAHSGRESQDLSPLAGMSIYDLQIDFEPARDTEVLALDPKLEKINGKPAAEFWKEFQPK